MKKQLLKKLYAFIVTVMMLTVTANAQIVYTDIIPDTTSSDTYNLDLNNDGIPDFIITHTSSASTNTGGHCTGANTNNYIRVTPLDSNQVVDTIYPRKLLINTLIDSSSLTWGSSTNQNLRTSSWACTPFGRGGGGYRWLNSFTGYWSSSTDGYVGFKLKVNGNTYYGWVRLSISSAVTLFTVRDYAYNSIPDQPILTGQSNNAPLASLTSTAFCAGDSMAIPLATYGIFNANNYFIAQLSDSVGSFNNPTILDSIQSTHADTIHSRIPTGIYPGINYKIRIVSTDTALQGAPTNNFTITKPPVAMISTLADTICPVGAVLNLNNSGPCIGCSYQWQFNGSNISNSTGTSTPVNNSGRYNVAITNVCGVSISNTDTIFVMPLINITIPDSMIVCKSDMPMKLNVATPAGGTYQGFGITSPDIFDGIYIGGYAIYYIIYDSYGCRFTSPEMRIMVNTCAGVSEISNSNAIHIYPNPADNHVAITLGSNNKKVEVTITDLTGKIIYTTIATDTQKVEVNTKDFKAGIYVVQIQAADFIETRRLIIAK